MCVADSWTACEPITAKREGEKCFCVYPNCAGGNVTLLPVALPFLPVWSSKLGSDSLFYFIDHFLSWVYLNSKVKSVEVSVCSSRCSCHRHLVNFITFLSLLPFFSFVSCFVSLAYIYLFRQIPDLSKNNLDYKCITGIVLVPCVPHWKRPYTLGQGVGRKLIYLSILFIFTFLLFE